MQLIKLKRFVDDRGWFEETYSAARYPSLGIEVRFLQDNHVFSRAAGVLRGLHFQRPPHAQAKLIRCVRGRIWDVAVDVRSDSPTYGRWEAAELSAHDSQVLFVPVGYAHGYLTLEPETEVEYKVSDIYEPACEDGLIWNDPDIAIPWPLPGRGPSLSDRDRQWPMLAEFVSPFAYDGRPLVPLAAQLVG